MFRINASWVSLNCFLDIILLKFLIGRLMIFSIGNGMWRVFVFSLFFVRWIFKRFECLFFVNGVFRWLGFIGIFFFGVFLRWVLCIGILCFWDGDMGWIVFLEDCIGCVLGLFCLIFLGVLFVFFILELLKLSGVFL